MWWFFEATVRGMLGRPWACACSGATIGAVAAASGRPTSTSTIMVWVWAAVLVGGAALSMSVWLYPNLGACPQQQLRSYWGITPV